MKKCTRQIILCLSLLCGVTSAWQLPRSSRLSSILRLSHPSRRRFPPAVARRESLLEYRLLDRYRQQQESLQAQAQHDRRRRRRWLWLLLAAAAGMVTAFRPTRVLASEALDTSLFLASQAATVSYAVPPAPLPPAVVPVARVAHPLTLMAELTLVLRLCFAALIGAALGKERSGSSAHHPAAGVRTMALVSLGAATFTLCSMYGFHGVSGRYDPSRMAANVASGVGFVGAGVITTTSTTLRPGNQTSVPSKQETLVHGLTTAAAIWLSAAVGVASAVGLYFVAGAGSLLTISILRLGRVTRTIQRQARTVLAEQAADESAGSTESYLAMLESDTMHKGQQLATAAQVVSGSEAGPAMSVGGGNETMAYEQGDDDDDDDDAMILDENEHAEYHGGHNDTMQGELEEQEDPIRGEVEPVEEVEQKRQGSTVPREVTAELLLELASKECDGEDPDVVLARWNTTAHDLFQQVKFNAQSDEVLLVREPRSRPRNDTMYP